MKEKLKKIFGSVFNFIYGAGIILLIVYFLYSCTNQPTYSDGYDEGYEKGYDSGYISGYNDGVRSLEESE